MRTEVSFQNYNEKEEKKIFGSISPQNQLFEQVIAIKSGSNRSLNTQVLSWFEQLYNESYPRAAKWKEVCMT